MSKSHRFTAGLMVLVMLCGVCCVSLAENEYPTTWDLTQVYADGDAWQADYDKAEALISQCDAFRGTLNTAQGIYDFFCFYESGELRTTLKKLSMYASLGCSLNPADPAYSTMKARVSGLYSQFKQHIAYVNDEIYALPLEERQGILSDPLLADWAYYLKDFADPKKEPLSEETFTALAILSPSMWRANAIFDIIDSIDLPYPTITMPDGTEAELTDELYAKIVSSNEYDRDFKALCNQTVLTRPISFVNTFAALLNANAAQYWAFAQIDKYDSTREAAMASSDVDPAVYDMLISAARSGAPEFQRFLNIHQRGLKLDVQYPFDTVVNISDYQVGDIPFDDAVKLVREALSVLGDDYLAVYDEMVSSGHLDVYPTDTKVTGAFSMDGEDGGLPFLLFNYNEQFADVDSLAHEMGHAIYTVFAQRTQQSQNAQMNIFTQEIASTTNELLFYSYMMNNAASDDEKLCYLEEMLQSFNGAFFYQAIYAEFEDGLYKTVEAGESLDAETLSDQWAALYQTYRGDTVKTFPDARYGWATVPHFYYDYYVYQYATSICYAASICEGIMNGEENAVENYKAFLKLGGSASPAELLAVAGVDPMNEETYQKAMDFYKGLVDEYEQMVDAKLAAK